MNRWPAAFERVAVIEPLCRGLEHVPFNAALVATVLEACPRAAVDVYGEEQQLAAIRELLGYTRSSRLGRVMCHPIAIPSRRIKGWERFRRTGQFFRDLDAAFDKAPAALVVSTADSSLVAQLKWRLFGAWKGRAAVAVFHEVLASLERWPSRRRIGLVATFAAPHPPTLKYVVLCDVIRDHLWNVAPRMARHVVSIDHPSLLGDVTTAAPVHCPPPLRFGFVGGGRVTKKLVDFARLAREVRGQHPNVEFHIIGPVGNDVPPSELDGLAWSRQPLPLPEYIQRIRRLSHVIWLGDPDHYRLAASGSLADVIALGIPLVCQSCPFADHLFRRFGEIGSLCQTMAHVRDEVINLASNFAPERDRLQRERIRNARPAMAPETYAERLRLALSSGGPPR